MAQHSSGDLITIQRIQPRDAGRLTLTSEAVGEDGRIGDAYSGHHDNLSPPLVWTLISDAESFALVVEDPDAPLDKPVVHWVAWNIPGSLLGLPGAIKPDARVAEIDGMVQGLNTRGQHGYMGPKPPAGDGPHHYHVQLFALDARIDLPSTALFETLVEVLKGHTIASCDLVGLYEQDADPVAPAEIQQEPRSFTGEAELTGLGRDDLEASPASPVGTAISSGSAGT